MYVSTFQEIPEEKMQNSIEDITKLLDKRQKSSNINLQF